MLLVPGARPAHESHRVLGPKLQSMQPCTAFWHPWQALSHSAPGCAGLTNWRAGRYSCGGGLRCTCAWRKAELGIGHRVRSLGLLVPRLRCTAHSV